MEIPGAILVAVGIVAIIILFSIFNFILLWFRALISGAPVGFPALIGMRFRGLPPKFFVDAYIKVRKNNVPYDVDQMQGFIMAGGDVDKIADALIRLHNAGISVPAPALQSLYQSHGDVDQVADGLISAQRANIALDYQTASGISLAGRNVLDAVHTSVTPKVIDVPPVTGTAKDGVQLLVKTRVTVRTEIKRLVGGATEQTIIARVGQGIVAAVGQALTFKEVLANPSRISQLVLSEGLDAETAFQILSIDIADIDVGKNIGAELQASQAEADMRTATAKAQERKAMAEASAQEMIAKTQEMRAKVVESEAQVPLAMAEALKAGNLGVMDYFAMKNIQSDTEMRGNIGKLSGGGSPEQGTKPEA